MMQMNPRVLSDGAWGGTGPAGRVSGSKRYLEPGVHAPVGGRRPVRRGWGNGLAGARRLDWMQAVHLDSMAGRTSGDLPFPRFSRQRC